MTTILLIVILLLVVVTIGLQFRSTGKGGADPKATEIIATLAVIQQLHKRGEEVLRDEFQKNRTEASSIAREGREEQSTQMVGFSNQLQQRLAEGGQLQQQSLQGFAANLQTLSHALTEQIDRFRKGNEDTFGAFRTHVSGSLETSSKLLLQRIADDAIQEQQALQGFSANLQAHSKSLTDQLEQFKAGNAESIRAFEAAMLLKLDTSKEDAARSDSRLRDEVTSTLKSINDSVLQRLLEISTLQKGQLDTAREDASSSDSRLRDELTNSLKSLNDSVLQRLSEASTMQKEQLDTFAASIGILRESMEGKLETVRLTVEGKLKDIQEDNSKQLDQMRATVEEKLQGTLETRLGEAFKQVSERLDQVHKGLGEMQSLATGVGDLKRVLSNVKTRGGWGEVQLSALLEQMLTPDQFERNVRIKDDSQESVEFAIKLPGATGDKDEVVWLPVDSKFPIEDYQRLVAAQEIGDVAGAEEASKALATSVTNCAKQISSKYLNPPHTTDFGIMFLPTEGLFAEIIRRPGLIEKLQHEWRVVVAGPTTFAALLNSLQMGFKTLTIQKQSSEVWKILGAVKTEFGKFGGAIEAVKKKLDEASKKIDDVDVRTRAVNRRLKTVEAIEQPLSSPPLVVLTEGENGDVDEPE